MLTRREFLQTGASALAATALPVSLRGRARPPQRIVIAGAGIAGLVAAYELERAGHDVLVFEAKSIPGGRIHTIRAPFADGLYAEAGAMYLVSHPLTLEYVRAFDLPTAPLSFRSELGTLAYLAGQRVEQRPNLPVRWPVALSTADANESLRALQGRYFLSQLRDLDSYNAPNFPQPAHLSFDDISIAELWRRNGASPEAIRIMRLSYYDGYGDGIEHASSLQVIRERASFRLGTAAPFQVVGGNDLLPRALANRLGARIRYGSPVLAVRHNQEAVQVTVEDRAGRHQVSGDRVILALPASMLRFIDFAPALPERRARIIQTVETTPMTIVQMQTRQRFWEVDGNDGIAHTDLPIQSIYNVTLSQTGTRGILQASTYGPRATRLAGMSDDERLRLVVGETTKVHPRLPEFYEGGTSYNWTNDPWSRGGHVYFRPGQMREFFPYVQQPEGRIHFAGDWVGGIPGYVHGAVMSARSVVRAIQGV